MIDWSALRAAAHEEIMVKRFSIGLFLLLGPGVFAQQPVPEIPFDSVPNLLKLPQDLYLGEASGVAVNSARSWAVPVRAPSRSRKCSARRARLKGPARVRRA